MSGRGTGGMNVGKIVGLFGEELSVINMGLESFAEEIAKQDVRVLPMSWHPPAGGDRELIRLLEKLGR